MAGVEYVDYFNADSEDEMELEGGAEHPGAQPQAGERVEDPAQGLAPEVSDDEYDEDSDLSDSNIEAFTDDEEEDTTARDAFRGKDIQGIHWENTPWTRERYRAKRDAEYPPYFNREAEVLAAEPALAAAATPRHATRLFAFARNWRRARATIVHFQLRNLLAAPAAHSLYYVADNRVMHWNCLGRDDPDAFMDLSGQGAAAVAPGLGTVQVCTLCANEGLVAAGGFNGEVVARRIGAAEKISASVRLSTADNAITNAIDVHATPSGALRLACSNNDAAVRLLDGDTFALAARFPMPWAVNCCASQPRGGRLLCAVGDDPVAQLLDPRSGRSVGQLSGHVDYSFAAAWHPDGMVVATGNQDRSTRVYDLRAPAAPLALLRANIGAVRALRFSPDGRQLAAAEAADYVAIYDVTSGYRGCQSLDVFGEIAGIAFSPAGDKLWAALADLHYASVVQLDKIREKPERRRRAGP